ncbi:NupC/NupG family nucleoside CNT transporter [Necropsobacter rosorum]|uniref:NupC/NupG family nucleoside CNT transporter n=1 Tax=Necropsobacter rosorum TaxID=908285 RepID=UPI000509B769
MSILNSLFGIFILLLIAFLLSGNKKAINFRTVFGAFALQIGIGALILYVPWGRSILMGVSDGVGKIISFGGEGIKFLFGGLVSQRMADVLGNDSFVFALYVLPSIIFFSALISLLYYLGVMSFVIRILGGALQKLLKTSKTESTSAAANIFVGQTEAPLLVRPYIKNMTKSELFAVMTGGLASVAGANLAGYVGLGIPLPYLIAASFMAAPGGLLFAKIILPQTETPQEDISDNYTEEKPANIIDAAAGGAISGVQLAINIGAMLVAFIALIAMLNWIIGAAAGAVGFENVTLQSILGYIFQPIAWAIGVPWQEAHLSGSMIGQKLVLNEFVAYIDFVQYLSPDSAIQLQAKTVAIVTFALCGFANFGSIAILIGGLGSMAPNRRSDIAKLGLKAVIAGSLSNLMSGAIAGLFIGIGGQII